MKTDELLRLRGLLTRPAGRSAGERDKASEWQQRRLRLRFEDTIASLL